MAVNKSAPKKKVKKVKKAAKKKAEDKASRKADPSSTEDAAAAKARNPKAFVFSGRGKAKLQQVRSAERDQKRMHGTVTSLCNQCFGSQESLLRGATAVGNVVIGDQLHCPYTESVLTSSVLTKTSYCVPIACHASHLHHSRHLNSLQQCAICTHPNRSLQQQLLV